jgi:hypothetical protein
MNEHYIQCRLIVKFLVVEQDKNEVLIFREYLEENLLRIKVYLMQKRFLLYCILDNIDRQGYALISKRKYHVSICILGGLRNVYFTNYLRLFNCFEQSNGYRGSSRRLYPIRKTN